MTIIVPTSQHIDDMLYHYASETIGGDYAQLDHCHDNSGQVLAFPLTRQAATVLRTAEAVNDRHGAQADRYWRSMIADMRAMMVAAGISEEAVECELRAFSDSVFSQIGGRCA